MTAEAKVLEITIDGASKGLVHLVMNGNIKIRKLRIDKIECFWSSISHYGPGYIQAPW